MKTLEEVNAAIERNNRQFHNPENRHIYKQINEEYAELIHLQEFLLKTPTAQLCEVAKMLNEENTNDT